MIKQNPLPQEERDFLSALAADADPDAVKIRLRTLFSAGWSLTTLGEALTPPRPRATVHYWIRTAPAHDPSHAAASTPTPTPSYPSSTLISELVPDSASVRSISPSVPEQFVTLLPRLALEARRYRARMSPNSRFAVANRQFTEICKELHSLGVPSQKIADAAGVSYRAIARRVAK